jgi:hypothetical protein
LGGGPGGAKSSNVLRPDAALLPPSRLRAGDGLKDVISTSLADNKVAWYKNGGGPSPSWTAYTIVTGANEVPNGVHVADVDNDGRVDVLGAVLGDNQLYWFKNGPGSPPSWTAYALTNTLTTLRAVYLSDLDGDGRVDALGASDANYKLAWYKNGGGSPPTWTANIISQTVDAARKVLVFDINGECAMCMRGSHQLACRLMQAHMCIGASKVCAHANATGRGEAALRNA